jgi:hypothetical protein
MDNLTNDDLNYVDDGDGWRVYPPTPIDKEGIQGPIEYIRAGGAKTGIWYAIGPDSRTGETKLAWVKWPKSVWSLDDLQSDPNIPLFFTKCNICHSHDQLKQLDQTHNAAAPQRRSALVSSQPQYSESVDYYEPPSRSEGGRRYSIADAVPKLLPFIIDFGKQILLNEFGDVVSTTVISGLADIVGGTSDDPEFRAAMQAFSDSQIDDLVTRCQNKPEYVDRAKKGIGLLYDGYKKDGKILDSIKGSMVRPLDDVLKSAGIETRSGKGGKRGGNIGGPNLFGGMSNSSGIV